MKIEKWDFYLRNEECGRLSGSDKLLSDLFVLDAYAPPVLGVMSLLWV